MGDIHCGGGARSDAFISHPGSPPSLLTASGWTSRPCHWGPPAMHSTTSTSMASGQNWSITSWNNLTSTLFLSHPLPQLLITTSGTLIGWLANGANAGHTCFRQNTTRASRPRSSHHSRLQCSGDSVPMSTASLKPSPSSYKELMRRTLYNCSQQLLTGRTHSKNLVFFRVLLLPQMRSTWVWCCFGGLRRHEQWHSCCYSLLH